MSSLHQKCHRKYFYVETKRVKTTEIVSYYPMSNIYFLDTLRWRQNIRDIKRRSLRACKVKISRLFKPCNVYGRSHSALRKCWTLSVRTRKRVILLSHGLKISITTKNGDNHVVRCKACCVIKNIHVNKGVQRWKCR